MSCLEDDCDGPSYVKGLCYVHYHGQYNLERRLKRGPDFADNKETPENRAKTEYFKRSQLHSISRVLQDGCARMVGR